MSFSRTTVHNWIPLSCTEMLCRSVRKAWSLSLQQQRDRQLHSTYLLFLCGEDRVCVFAFCSVPVSLDFFVFVLPSILCPPRPAGQCCNISYMFFEARHHGITVWLYGYSTDQPESENLSPIGVSKINCNCVLFPSALWIHLLLNDGIAGWMMERPEIYNDKSHQMPLSCMRFEQKGHILFVLLTHMWRAY